MGIVWVIIHCNTSKEAQTLGKQFLKERLCACFDIVPRTAAYYFWPPKKNKVEKSKGCILIIETFEKHHKKIKKIARLLHSDTLPFIGVLEIKHVEKEYINWMKSEIKI